MNNTFRNNKLNNQALYASVHYWLKSNYGVATKCESNLVGLDCRGSKNYNWANLKNKEYTFKRENFIQLCRSCHARYDCTETTRKKMKLILKGKPASKNAYIASKKKLTGISRTEEDKRKMKEGWKKRKLTLRDKK